VLNEVICKHRQSNIDTFQKKTSECVPYNTDYVFKVASGEHTQSRDVLIWGRLLIIMWYRQLMPGIIFTRLA